MNERAECIEREALIKFVRGVRKRLPVDSKDFFTRDEMLLNFQQYVEHQPAADVEKVVKCNACIYKSDELCNYFRGSREDDDFFCAHGKERR